MKKILWGIGALVVVGVAAALYVGPPALPQKQDSSNSNATMNDTNTPQPDTMTMSATIKTEKGDINVTLFLKVAPKTVENFVKLAKQGFYDGVTWHRVVPGFVIQGGDPLSKDNDPSNDGTGGPGYTLEDEINAKSLGLSDSQIADLEKQGYKYRDDLQSRKMTVGALAMANSGPNTNGSQFFIVTDEDQPHLNGKHTVFGEVASGMDVVKKVKQGDKILTITINE